MLTRHFEAGQLEVYQEFILPTHRCVTIRPTLRDYSEVCLQVAGLDIEVTKGLNDRKLEQNMLSYFVHLIEQNESS